MLYKPLFSSEKEGSKDRWGWHGLIIDMAEETSDKLLNIEKIYDTPYLIILNVLSRQKEHNDRLRQKGLIK